MVSVCLYECVCNDNRFMVCEVCFLNVCILYFFFFSPPLARRNSVFPLAFSFFIFFFVSLLIVYKYGQKRGHGREGEGFLNGQ